jgi:hypothetical protein
MKMEMRRRALDKVYKRRDRIDMPDFQREEVWTEHQKRQLIDTVLRGWHLPKFYFRRVDEASFECVDGQQRLMAVFEFFDGHLKLDPKAARAYGGATYKDLRPTFSDAFDDFEIDIEEIDDATDRELEELFVRLQLGTPLTTAEKLNALGGEARDFGRWMSDQPFFEKSIAVRDTRYAHFDIATKWLFVEARGIQAQMRFPQLEAFLRDGRSFDSPDQVGNRIRGSLKFLHQAFPAKCDLLRNRASVLSVCMLAGRVVESRVHQGTAAQFGRFVNRFFARLSAEVEKGPRGRDAELRRYQEAISYGSTGGDSVRTRLAILSLQLSEFDRVFAPVTSGAASTDAMGARLRGLAEEVSELLYADNERAAGRTGVDVFKMTNKTTRAVKKLGDVRESDEDFGALVDDLYALVYEGSGQCKRLPVPPPQFAMDLKFLRNNLRHDLDHGDEADAARKRRRGGELLKKYLGTTAVKTASGAQFRSAQLRLLNAVRRLLKGLLQTSPQVA